MKVAALMAGICLTALSACAQPAPGQYGQDGTPPGYGQPGPGSANGQGVQPGYAGGWAGGMQGAGGQTPPPGADGAPPPPPGAYGGQPGAPGGESAMGGGHEKLKERFEVANVTHDGRLTQQQAQAAHMGKIARNFAQIDRDQKGYVTMQDIKAWRHEKREAKMSQAQPPQGGAAGGAPGYPPPAPAGGYGSPPPGQQY